MVGLWKYVEIDTPRIYMTSKYIHAGQLSLKLPWVGFELTTLHVLSERSTN